ncbi:hypothetical protein [Geminocystis sp. GBBB08]|uniref:hypothetical protein n=1 Tax=Geminocystis sp. GBBB08 TaxID=2604140 RepID=UPI0027E2B942|nr:hypothetical protein [Geminocystis sp. GBBB08]
MKNQNCLQELNYSQNNSSITALTIVPDNEMIIFVGKDKIIKKSKILAVYQYANFSKNMSYSAIVKSIRNI